MTILLSVNSYDKDAYVRRWIEQARSLGPGWRVQVVTNAPGWPLFDAETVRCGNPDPVNPLGYRECLRATQLRHDDEVIVSVHAKTWLPDVALLERLVERLHGHDAVMLPQGQFIGAGGGELLFLMVFARPAWDRLVDRIPGYDPGIWNEVMVARLVRELNLRVYRASGDCPEPEFRQNYWVRDVDGSGTDLFGCEPGRWGFGHYLRGGYTRFSTAADGVTTQVKRGEW